MDPRRVLWFTPSDKLPTLPHEWGKGTISVVPVVPLDEERAVMERHRTWVEAFLRCISNN